ncbi:TonB-dependent receptor [Vulcaniibacterium tengchongense]|uniref:Carboxypeptidase family protein n=1 Tax=Vulcaniibacterium tengchongense TaxID=1273429 RepID=A0A3N4VII2_9GAMM|nr:TonB-dependent receptor [Vulcaniibacterium tengchongense]RPE81483.1 carboxypeptidase family protein [Vulcaniibacterium tengchongense]
MKSQPLQNRRPVPRLLACALASCLAIAAPAALAQSTAATVRGQITVDSAPAGQADVTVTNLATGLTRKVQASNGSYNIGGLPPGTYRIDAVADGRSTSRTVTLQVGQTATLNLSAGGVPETAAPGEATELDAVTVTSELLPEVRTSEIATYISNKQIEALPQGTRNFLAFADLVPGVMFERGTEGSTRIRSGASNPNGINVYIDGVGQKDYVLRGGISGQDSSRGNPFPQSAIGEYKVITQNYKAEFDQLNSAAIVASTRSGTNEFEGSFFWDHTATDWRTRSVFEERAGEKTETKETQYGATFGGPILRDVAHFFLAYEAKEYESPRTLEPGRGFQIPELPPALQQEAGSGLFSAPFKEDLYFAKIDWLIGENHYFELSGKYRDESEITNIGGQNLPSYGTAKLNEEKRGDLRYQYTNGPWLNDAHLTFEDSSYNPSPSTAGVAYILSDGTNFNDVIVRTGAGSDFQDKGQKGWGFQNDLTFTGWQGHTLKMGVKFKDVDVRASERQPYYPQFTYDINGSWTRPIHVKFGTVLPGVGDGNAESSNKQYGIYFQDDWEVNDKLTLNLGLRYDYEESPSYLDYVTPADVAASLRSSTALNNPNSGINVEDYISTGHNRKSFKDGWQPRLGFSYDLNADQEHVVYGGVGRAYDRNLFDWLQLEITKSTFPSVDIDFIREDGTCPRGNDPTIRCIAWDPAYYDPAVLATLASTTGEGREVFVLDNNLKVPYTDQFSLGMRNTVGEWLTDATLSYVEGHDGFAFLLGNRRPDGTFFAPGFRWGQPWGQGFPGFGNLILGTNGLKTRTSSLYLKAEKPYTAESGWGVTFAYTYMRAKEMRESPEAFSLDYPTLEDYGWNKAEVPEHRFVATGIYDGPLGMTFSGKLTLASQAPRYATNCLDVDRPDNCFIDQYKPSGTFGFKQVDLAVQKNFDTGAGFVMWVRGDIFNVFDWANYIGYDDWYGGFNDPNENFGRPTVQALPTRTFKLSLGFNF